MKEVLLRECALLVFTTFVERINKRPWEVKEIVAAFGATKWPEIEDLEAFYICLVWYDLWLKNVDNFNQ